MAGVAIEDVRKSFARIEVLKGVSTGIEDGELRVVLGPSGCGKSTLLRLVAGLEEITSGTIRIGERVVNDLEPKDRDIAMVFQNYALYPHMSVYKNMAFGLELRYGAGWGARIWNRLTRPSKANELASRRRDIKRQVQEAARVLAIEPLLDRMPRQLSGGERQRVALGRAIVRQPAAFLFDEPLSNLDARLRVAMRYELKRLHQRLDATVVHVTHDQVEALTLGDRIAVMDKGRLQQVGSPREVYDRPHNRFVAEFIGSPPMNLLAARATVADGRVRVEAPGWAVTLDKEKSQQLQDRQYAGREVVLGVRPEDIVVRAAGAGEPAGDASRGSAAPRGTVTLVEPLGDATIVHVELDGGAGGGRNTGSHAAETIVAKADARTTIRAGDAVRATIDAARAHVFDADTGANVGLPALR